MVVFALMTACGGGGDTFASTEELAAAMSEAGIDCDPQPGGAGMPGDPAESSECSSRAVDDILSLAIYDEARMQGVRSEVALAAQDEDDAFVVGANWVVLSDPPNLQRVADAMSAEYVE